MRQNSSIFPSLAGIHIDNATKNVRSEKGNQMYQREMKLSNLHFTLKSKPILGKSFNN